MGPGLRQGLHQPEQLAEGRFLLRAHAHLLHRPLGMGEDPAAEPFMQAQQAGGGAGQAAAQDLPVVVLDHQAQGAAQQQLQVFGLGDHQLAIPQGLGAPGLHQLAVIEQPQPGLGWGGRALPAGQGQAGGLEPGQLHLQQPLAQLWAHHQGQAGVGEGDGHEQGQQPAGVAAGGQAHQGLVSAPQAAGRQAAEGEVVGPAGFPLQPEECLELLVGQGFQHGAIVGSWGQRTGASMTIWFRDDQLVLL